MSGPNTVMIGGVPIDLNDLDLNDHSSNVGSVKTANITLIVLVGFFVGLRLFVRAYMVRKIFADDATNFGLGTHVWLFPLPTILDKVRNCVQQYLYVCQVLYACAIAFTKIAIIASYLRFVQDPKFRMAMYATAVVIVGLWFTGIFVTIFQCRPVSGAWNFTNPARKCIDYVDYLYASSAVTIATDIILCVLPWPYLWKLNMPLKQRVILCLLFGGGAGACVASIIRIANLDTLRNMDVTYQCVPCLNLSVIECSLGIICVSIPALRPLAGALFPKLLRSNPSSSAKSPIQNNSLAQRSSRSDNNTRNPHHHGSESTLFRPDGFNEECELFDRTATPAPNSKKEDSNLKS
ncbi:hypothetical protein K505DRAFT_260196 [Melanomma pulvis-pyrius CBS 109.77]|uniref:Rhodopsin domain-containing protein n=1 Tax=Melanomma pulvis-pyrius CBS 109.77 TaxID=1314802 RepID=A0A6A6WQD7_9PLEO|nr:hypothetical protein K505DRAFT_260196 [Melanomma pulvis-pyrius CBS 109.77]